MIMNSLFVASLLFLGVLLLNPSLTTGKRSKVPKVRCYKVYNAEGNCRKRIKGLGRITLKDCCESGGGVAYQVSKSKRGKKKCLPCTTEENWSAWEAWTKCNSQCGPGISRRTRKCLDTNNRGCPGSRSEKKQCVNPLKPNCPVHGSWSDWGNWSSCSVSCGQGRQLRFRSCSNPKPQYGGRDCQGVREDKRDCMDALHCPVRGEWGSWGPWSSCTVTCSIGWNERKRKCDNPKPRYGGLSCKGDEKERRSCDTYTKCDGGSGSGDFSGSSGDGSGSGSGGGSGSGVGSVLSEGEDDDDGSAGSGQQQYEESTIKSGSDFDFSKPTDSSLMADSSNDGN